MKVVEENDEKIFTKKEKNIIDKLAIVWYNKKAV